MGFLVFLGISPLLWVSYVIIYWCSEIYFLFFIFEDTLIERLPFHLFWGSDRKPSLGTAWQSSTISKPGITEDENKWIRNTK